MPHARGIPATFADPGCLRDTGSRNGPAGSSDLQQARRAFTMTPLPDGSLLAIGGADGGGASRSTSEIFAAAGTPAAG